MPRSHPGTLQLFNKYLMSKQINLESWQCFLYGYIVASLFFPFPGKLLIVFSTFGFQIAQEILFPQPLFHSFIAFFLFTKIIYICFSSVQFTSVTQSCLTLCDPMNCSMPGLPVHHQLPEFTQTHVHWVGDAIQPSHLLSSPSPPAFNLSQHQGLFQ